MPCPTEVEIGDNLVFSVCTHDPDTGVLTDADAVPAYRLYEDETDPPILTGNMAKLDDDDTTGFYTELVACTSGNGFENGKSYTIYITATVDGDLGGISYGFKAYDQRKSNVIQWLSQACAAVSVNGVPEVDLTHVMGTILTEGGAGRLAAAIIKLFDVVTPTLVASDVMRGTDSANTTVPDAAGTASGLHTTTDGKVDAIQTDLGNFSGRTNDQTLLDVLGVPDVAGKDLHTLLVTDRLDQATYGLSALQTLLAAIPTTAMRGTDNAATASGLSTHDGKLDTVDTNVDTLLTRITAAVALASVCTEGRLAELDAANLPTDIAAIPTTAMRGTDNGATEAKQDIVDTNIDTLLTRITALIATKAQMDTAHALLATPAQVNTEVSDVIKTDTYTLPGQEAPTATPTLEEAIMFIYKFLTNKRTDDGSNIKIFARDETTVDQKNTISDDGSTYTHGEFGTGP